MYFEETQAQICSSSKKCMHAWMVLTANTVVLLLVVMFRGAAYIYNTVTSSNWTDL